MKKWKKILLAVVVLAVIAIVISYSVNQANKDVVMVQTGKVNKADLTSLVTASGEIKPKTYANVGGEGFGKVVDLGVKEGDRVKKGDFLLRLENIQATADVNAQQFNIEATDAAIKSAEANFRSSQADLNQRKADLDRTKADWERAKQLFENELIAKSEYDSKKASFEGALAAVDASTARLQQGRADLDRARSVSEQGRAILNRTKDVLRKTTYVAPIDGVVTYIAVRVGENVVMGIQNSPGSYLMTISDMSLVTAEVKVDETDIVNVKVGQDADVTIDAIPGKIFKAKVLEVGTQAVLRTSGLATTQTTTGSQEAKDFKVIIALSEPSANIHPGLSTTAKIKTAERHQVLAIPMQALAVRTRKDIEDAQKEASKKGVTAVTLAAAKNDDKSMDPKKEEIQGVFVVQNGKAVFRPVKTGITGVTDIEVTDGLKEGDEIVTGSYKALRTLKHGAPVKVDNKAPGGEDKKG